MNEQGSTVSVIKDRRPTAAGSQSGIALVIGAHALDAAVVREVHWIAKEAGVPLTVYMIGPTGSWASALLTPQAEQIKRMSERLEARLITATAKDSVDAITSDWNTTKPSQIIFGPKKHWPWGTGVSASVIRKLGSHAQQHGIETVLEAPVPRDAKPHMAWRLDRNRPWYHDYVLSLFAVCIAALSVQWLKNSMPAENLSIVFLTAVIFSATAYGLAAALFSSVISVALFDFFFVSPTFTFSFTSADNVLLVLLFLLVSGITSNLAGKLRDQAEAAQEREGEARALFQLTRDIATSDTTEEIYAAVARQSAAVFDAVTIVLLPHQKNLA